MLNNLFKFDKDLIVFTGEYLEVYVPQSFEETNLYQDLGDYIEVFGMLNLRTFTKDKPNKLMSLNLPTSIYLYPSDIDKQNLSLIQDTEGEPIPYLILKFYNGDVFTNKDIRMDSKNAESFLDLLFAGHMPNTIPYSEVAGIWANNLELNDVNLNVPSVVREFIIAQMYRYKDDPSYKFGQVRGKNPKISDYDYETGNIRQTSSRTSVFSAMSFEDMDYMITSSLNMTNYERNQSESPVEKIIKM